MTEFEASQHNVVTLPASKKISAVKRKPSLAKLKKSKALLATAIHNDIALKTEPAPLLTQNASAEYRCSGIGHKVLQRLNKGDFSIDATLDLHGYPLAKALTALSVFIHTAVEQQQLTLLVVHGKGLSNPDNTFPILKNAVNQWLREHPAIIAFASAPIKYGGTGASIILLKRSR